MPRRQVKVKTGKRIDDLRAEAANLTGLDKALLDDLLVEYDALSAMVDTLRKDVEENGIMTEREAGPASNPRIERVERPEFTSYRKALNDKASLGKRISDFAKRSDEEVEEDADEALFS